MEIKESRNGDKLVLEVEGRIDTTTTPKLFEVFQNNVSGLKELVIDLKGVDYVSSAGLRIVVKLKQQFDQTSLVKVPSGVNDIFEMVGLPAIIKIERL